MDCLIKLHALSYVILDIYSTTSATIGRWVRTQYRYISTFPTYLVNTAFSYFKPIPLDFTLKEILYSYNL